MATNLTKAQLEAEVERLTALNDHKDELLENADERLTALESRIGQAPVDAGQSGRTPVLTKEEAHEYDPLGEPSLISDPFDTQNPHAIINHPAGFVLSWINPKYRASRGWRGWIRVEWDDEIGRNLTQYLNEVPDRMEGAVDNYVRRGDVVLCRLPEAYYRSRRNQREQVVQKYDAVVAKDSKPDTLGRRGPDDEEINGARLGGRTLLS